jgi:UDPglucose 6-dehydrogenase
MTKYVANCMLAVRISLMNDFANLCELVGADITMVRKGIAMDPRIGSKFLFPGVGYGGSCFPKDMKALITLAEDLGYPLRILEAADRVNERQKRVIPEKVLKHFDGNVRGKQFALWGLSFKPNTDDLREAPSLIIIESLLNNGARIVAYDPVAMENMKKLIGDRIAYAESSYKAVENADALIIVTEWNEFRTPDFEYMLKIMAKPIIFDGRNILLPKAARELGFIYYSLGRP